jgi:hypothetical protein
VTNYIARVRDGFMKTQSINLDKRLFLRPKEVEDIFGIKESTLRRQRTGNYGFPFTIIGRAPKKNKGGIIFYAVEDIKPNKFKFNSKK